METLKRLRNRALRKINPETPLTADFSMIPKLFKVISLYEWINASENVTGWNKCHMLTLNIEEPILNTL